MQFWEQFIINIKNTTTLEFIGVIAGIVSVWFSRKGNILVYPIGLINTTIFVYLSAKYHLFGEASVNFYYTIMSVYGWVLWSKKDKTKQHHILQITNSTRKEWMQQLAFFATFYMVLLAVLYYLKQSFYDGVIPWADAFASATAYTGMWLMAKKKTESWIWWIATNIASIPLYYIKGYAFTSVQYIILLILAVAGWITWYKKAKLKIAE